MAVISKCLVNLASGTRKESLMGSTEVGQQVLNIDSGHMLWSEVMRARPASWFEEAKAQYPINMEAFQKVCDRNIKSLPEVQQQNESAKQTVREDVLRDFIIREIMSAHPGEAGFAQLMTLLKSSEVESFQIQLKKVAELAQEKRASFCQGFVESWSKLVEPHSVDEVHVISALHFDLVNDSTSIEQVCNALKPGGKLIITAEKTGMVSKAMKQQGHDPVLDGGKPVVKPNINLLNFFTYDINQSLYGSFHDVFEVHYPGMATLHTSGSGAFQTGIPFARLVFTRK